MYTPPPPQKKKTPSRLVLENKFSENKSGRIVGVRQVYFTKSCQEILGREKQPFKLFIHHIWGEIVLWGAAFIIQTSNRMQYFTIFEDKLYSANIQDDQSWTFSETVQKISKITYTTNRFSLLTSAKVTVRTVSSVWMNINRVTLQCTVIKNLLCLFFYYHFMVL